MTEKEIIRMQKLIEAYILGKLDQREIDLLWTEFLKDPYWYDIFEIELHLRSFVRAAEK